VTGLWGLSFVVIAVGLRGVPPLMLAGLRFVLASVPAVFLVRRPAVSWRQLAAYGLLLGVGQFGLLFTGMAWGAPAGAPAAARRPSPPFSLLVPVFGLSSAALVLGERLTLRHGVATGLILAGVGLHVLGGWVRQRRRSRAAVEPGAG
jgi:O-acetylserine/cysteine efflux transporter